jgi:caa(3)-type oxidase subunit IV
MELYFRSPLTYVWLLLSIITVISWWLGTRTSVSAVSVVVVVLIACVKSRLVIWNFMEVSRAPTWLRVTCDSWLALTFGMIVSFYFFGR